MGKYIKLFNSHSDYEDFTESEDFILPNVSRCNSEKDMHYTPYYDYSQDYLTFEIISDGTIRWYHYVDGLAPADLNFPISYSLDNGDTWTSGNTFTLNVVLGLKVLFKGNNSAYYASITSRYGAYSKFAGTASFNVSGNIMSLVGGDNFLNTTTFGTQAFWQLFSTTNVINAKNLILPVTTLVEGCYRRMFMDCTSLITAPKLPATTLVRYCYGSMFSNCTSLTIAPELPATTLANYCYDYMFYNCSSLNYIKAMFTTTPTSGASGNTYQWVYGVAANGTFVKNVNATWTDTGAYAIPTGWTIQTVNP